MLEKVLRIKLKILLIAVLIVTLVPIGSAIYRTIELEVVNNQTKVPLLFKSKVVKIFVKGRACSGTILNSGHVLTAKHCTIPKKVQMGPFQLDTPNWDSIEYSVVSIADERKLTDQKFVVDRVHEKADIALLKPKGSESTSASLEEFDFTPLKVGTNTFILGVDGFKPASQIKMRPLKVERAMFLTGARTLHGSALEILGGTSGGAVINAQNKIVGVIILSDRDRNAGLTPVSDYKEWLEGKKGIDKKTPPTQVIR